MTDFKHRLAAMSGRMGSNGSQIEQRFLTSAREIEPTEGAEPGLVLEDDGTVWLVMPDGTRAPLTAGGTGSLTRRAMLFTQTSGSGTYTASISVPPGVSILDVPVFCLAGPWVSAVANLKIGDDVEGDESYLTALSCDLVHGLIVPYDAVDGHTNSHTSWLNPNLSGAIYGGAANWYSAGNAVYTPTVRYPDGATITATLVAVDGGPVTATNILDPGSPGEGYAPGDTCGLSAFSGDCALRVDTVDGLGAVLTYTITNPGTLYAPLEGIPTSTSGSGNFLALNVTAVDVLPLVDPGSLVADVIGFGVPTGPTIIPSKEAM